MDIKYILSKIDEERKDWYKSPSNYYNMKRIDFIYQSYKHSAMEEIKKYFIEHKNKDPISCIEDFKYEVDHFACSTKNGDANFMFSVYYDVANDILDVLLELI